VSPRALALGGMLTALPALAACGGEDGRPATVPIASRETRGVPADLVGRWRATQPGVEQLYFFHPNRRYTYSLETRQERRAGTATFTIDARGTFSVRGATLRLRPRGGTKKRRDPDDPEGDYTRPLERFPQTFEWSIRDAGDAARLVLTIGGGLAVTYTRQ
jgi:hypothetical protein